MARAGPQWHVERDWTAGPVAASGTEVAVASYRSGRRLLDSCRGGRPPVRAGQPRHERRVRRGAQHRRRHASLVHAHRKGRQSKSASQLSGRQIHTDSRRRRIYALGSDGDLACLETAAGKVHWQRNVRADLGGQPGEWAYAESPLVDGDLVVCTPGGADATLAALNKLTGEIVWRSAVPGADAAGYASIIIVQCDGVKQYVQFLSKGLVGVDAATGKFLWRYDRTATGPANIPTPVARDAFVYSGGARCGGGLVQLSANQGQVSAEEIYFDPGLPNGIGGFVQLGDCLYGAISTGMVCIDFQTGKTRWTNRGLGAGALCFADGKLYIHGENGDVGLIEAAPEAYRELGRFTPSDGPNRGNSKAWTYPVVADGRLYIRDLNSLWCYDVKAPQ